MISNDLEMAIAPAATLEIAAIWVDHTGGGLPSSAPVQPHEQSLRSLKCGEECGVRLFLPFSHSLLNGIVVRFQ